MYLQLGGTVLVEASLKRTLGPAVGSRRFREVAMRCCFDRDKKDGQREERVVVKDRHDDTSKPGSYAVMARQ